MILHLKVIRLFKHLFTKYCTHFKLTYLQIYAGLLALMMVNVFHTDMRDRNPNLNKKELYRKKNRLTNLPEKGFT